MFLKENIPESTKKSKKTKKMEKPEKCPLCCENMEIDDLNFLPCPCGYKVCLFCWNRIKTSESDPKCPLCRRNYSEDPAKFEPLSAEQLQKLKNKKKQEDVKKKQKLAEDRKQLADVRVVRKNLIFVNELPLNFNKDPKAYNRFSNIFKQAGQVKKTTVLNSSKNYAGQKAPYARAYVTYFKNEEALKALKLLENSEFEGKELKLSLGTTKYCSNYIKNVNCTNKECVYLHEQAEAEASFTKEQIHAGKHIEYGKMLYEQYVQNLNSMHAKSISNQIAEEKKTDPQPQNTEEPEKEIIIENSIPASTSQQNSHQIEKSSPLESDNVKTFKQIHELLNTANYAEPSFSNDSSRDQCEGLPNLSLEQCAVIKKYILSTPLINSPSNSSDLTTVNKGAKLDNSEPSFEERFAIKRESIVPNGSLFHEERYSPSIQESFLSRLNIPNSHKELSMQNADSHRNPFTKEIGSFRHINSDLLDPPNLKLESKDDCGLDFDPVNMALGGLGELVVSEKQKARVEVNSLNITPVNAFKKQSNQQPRVNQPIYSSNNFLPSTSYQNRSQNSPVIDYYNQASYRPSVQSLATVTRSSVHSQSITPSQRSQIAPFANALSIQLPRFSPGIPVGNNSMVNGYSPQQYISQVSPQDAFVLSQQQQQSQNFENFSQPQFSNFDQVTPPQVFSVNSLQNQSVRENPIRDFFGGNLPMGQQRLRNDVGRHSQFQQQQQQSFQHLQRINSYCNSTPQGESLTRPKGNNTFP